MPSVLRLLLRVGLTDSVTGSSAWASTKTFATNSPAAPGAGSLWQPAQASESGAEVRSFVIWPASTGSPSSESVGTARKSPPPVVSGRPLPSQMLNLVTNNSSPWSLISSKRTAPLLIASCSRDSGTVGSSAISEGGHTLGSAAIACNGSRAAPSSTRPEVSVNLRNIISAPLYR